MKNTLLSVLFALIAFPASAHISDEPISVTGNDDIVTRYYELDDTVTPEPLMIILPEVVIEGRVPTVAPKTVPHVEKVWYCGPVYENALGGHNQDCAWKEVR